MAEEIKREEREVRKSTRRRNNNDDHAKAKSWLKEWVDALVFAAIAALIIRTFLFEAYRIPSPSMEKTLLTGDFLVVSKISYGPRTPMVLAIPFTNMYLPGLTLPWTRLPGFQDVERNDVVVFNYPIDIAPISAKTNYIKRCVAIPGDTLAIVDKQVYINGEAADQFAGIQKTYIVTVQDRVRLSPAKVKAAGGTLLGSHTPNSYRVNMTAGTAKKIQGWSEVTDVEPFVLPENFNEFARVNFSFASGFNNHDHLPSMVIPFEGQEVTLTPGNWHIYENIITRYERNTAERNGDTFVINGEVTDTYTIKKDYYFMMGDNRDDSEDSRFWGFVPEDHIVGKAGIIYFSWDAEQWAPRFNRILNFIHD